MTEIARIGNIDDWVLEGQKLYLTWRQLNWHIGDWLAEGIEKFGPEAQSKAQELFHVSLNQLKTAYDVATRFPPDERKPELSFSHHALVMKLEPEQASEVLDQAAQTKTSAAALKKAVDEIRQSEGGDVHRVMATASIDEMVDQWTDSAIKLLNRSPNGDEGRRDVFEMFQEAKFGLVY